jgi:hypothetical protein
MQVLVCCFHIRVHRHSVTEDTFADIHREDENVNRLEVFLYSLIEIVVDVPVK